MLRIDGPLAANRRIVRRAVALGGRQFEPGDRLTIHWIAANRDPRAFDEPDSFRIDRDPSPNLLYGAGIHVCPGAPLARLELRVLMEELLARTSAITLAESRPPVRAVHPDAGYAALLVRLV
ncbi:cytochrome P450 [Ottowia beijingensis]|uniref:cytochrome P450 n=1 Tax=Ottowia beijingensis TaxID=1207057 RepID=UPI0028064244|nr:cytochrome P450 [Ottowia beijingensis]